MSPNNSPIRHVAFVLIALLCSTALAAPSAPTRLRFSDLSAKDECQQMQAGWIFCSGFEEGNKNIWDDYDGNPDSTNLIMADGGPKNAAGNHIMRLRVPAGRGNADLIKVLPASYDKLYARWYAKWENGYDFSALNHGGGLHAGNRNYLGQSGNRPNGDDWFTSWIEPLTPNPVPYAYTYYRGMYMDCPSQGSCYGDLFPCMLDEGSNYCTRAEHRERVTPPTIQAGRWYCVEMVMDAGTPSTTGAGATGMLDFWIDNLEIGPWTNLWFRTVPGLKLNILWLNLFHHGDHSVEGIMFDNVVVSTNRIGCL